MTDAELIPAEAGDNPFHADPAKPGFESLGRQNGFRYWLASEVAVILGYKSAEGFFKCVQKAMVVCEQIDAPQEENIVRTTHPETGEKDYKLSRFACYLATMNGDSKKPEVARAQAYFAAFSALCTEAIAHADGVERITIRKDVAEREGTLAGVAKAAGIENYPYFQNAGYRGLYNMDIWKLRERKGVPKDRSPLDFMGKTEMAANLFRITQTEEKIRNEKIRGQGKLESAAESVGRAVRDTIAKTGGTMPERLAPVQDIHETRKLIKSSHRNMKKLDAPKPAKKAAPAKKPKITKP